MTEFSNQGSLSPESDAHTFGIGRRDITLVDGSRPIKQSQGFNGCQDRRIDVLVWYPMAPETEQRGERWPLVVYSHGTFGRPDNNMHLVKHLVRHGYVVAAPNYPLTSSTAFTRITAPDISDTAEQIKDLSFVIDNLLTHEVFGEMIERRKIGVTGHSLGGIVSYFSCFGYETRDRRIKAAAMMGAGDPVQMASSGKVELLGVSHSEASVPALFLSGDKDLFARMSGQPHTAYARLAAPKYEVMIKGGAHVWFHDKEDDVSQEAGKNPDCCFFEKWMPGVAIPGCEERGGLTTMDRQQEIIRSAIRSFFDGYLKNDLGARVRMRGLANEFAEVGLLMSE